eukprot:760327-Hanusia_phi.AAC.4
MFLSPLPPLLSPSPEHPAPSLLTGSHQVREGHADVVRLLLEYGATKNHKNLEGLTVTQLADR